MSGKMDKWEKAIREKVHAANILTQGEWVYLVGALQAARENDEARPTPKREVELPKFGSEDFP